MILLAFETSTEACSVALWMDGEVRERYGVAPRQHAELALPWAEQLLADAGIARSRIDGVAVGRGPGAFTGVRLGVALAQGVALALGVPVVAVSTLEILAAQVGGDSVLAAIDARMGEVYLGAFKRDAAGLHPLQPEAVGKPDAIEIPAGDDWHGAGTGFAAADHALQQRLGSRLVSLDPGALPHAADLARLAAPILARGEGVAPERIEPAYLRNNVALTLAEQKAARGR